MHRQQDVIFEVADPYNVIISLSKETYDNHILKNHPELKGLENKIKQAIENPDYITKDKLYNTTYNTSVQNDGI